jgi:serine-type D-Ala-D-Ala carboxypeptidase/endopeptidase (penicillin-binding protein 4)
MVQVAAWITRQPWGPDLVDLLPIAGQDGTLQGRMVGTPAEGRARAKTGSMTGVRNIVGYVRNAAGEELVFAMLLNGLASPKSEAIALQDRVIALLAASKRRRVPRRSVAALVPSEG